MIIVHACAPAVCHRSLYRPAMCY